MSITPWLFPWNYLIHGPCCLTANPWTSQRPVVLSRPKMWTESIRLFHKNTSLNLLSKEEMLQWDLKQKKAERKGLQHVDLVQWGAQQPEVKGSKSCEKTVRNQRHKHAEKQVSQYQHAKNSQVTTEAERDSPLHCFIEFPLSPHHTEVTTIQDNLS